MTMTESRRVLLVDDSPQDIELALAAFEVAGDAEVVVAHGGEDAVRYLGSHLPPAVVLLDLKMPQMDGLTVLSHIRADEKLRYLPVVMLTTSNERGDIERCYQSGASAYLVKPADFDQLVETMRTVTSFWVCLNREHGT